VRAAARATSTAPNRSDSATSSHTGPQDRLTL